MENKEWFKSKSTVLGFSVAALIGSFLFLKPSITGKAILGEGGSFSFLSAIGFLLILCAAILAIYAGNKK